MPQSFQYGGQAVYEGVMMRGPQVVSLAVRKAGGDIILEKQHFKSLGARFPILKLPLFRGVIALFEALVLGVQMLTKSFNLAAEAEEEELSPREIAVTILVAVGLAVLLFIVIPTGAAHFTRGYLNNFWQNLLEGLLRIAIFLVYVLAIGRMKDIERVFQYHGAEHKVIHALEAGDELTVENAKKYTTLHPRCGTSFLLFVLVLTIFIYSLLETPGLLWRIGSRILLLPVIAGLAYEFIKWSGRKCDVPWVKLIIAPGLWLQKLTAREPDDSQLEVAICALEGALEKESGLAP
ncbi:MAG: DUF1385 domain-containing protein [Bacillota bacterium]|jgi:uncharacterized protein YqhQ